MITIKPAPGNKLAQQSLDNIAQNTRTSIRQAFYFVGKDLTELSQQMIADKNKGGRIYLVRLGNRNTKHQASAPGEAPANLTGNLRKSLGFEVRGSDQLEFGSRSGAPKAGVSPKQAVADYAAALEVGTSKVEARPYLKPSVKSNTGNATQHFERELQKVLCK